MPQEAAERHAASEAMLQAASAWGYRRIETPALEFADTLACGAGAAIEGDAFRLFDLDGGLLALRPEMTVPIARMVAARFGEPSGVRRLSYRADVYREHAGYRGQYRQFTQVGCELVGASGARADAECVEVLAEMLAATGLADFTVAIGTVGVVEALLEASRQRPVWREAVMEALHARNLVELDVLTGGVDIDEDLRRALREVPRLRGGTEALVRCRQLVEPCGSGEPLDALEATWRVLETSGIGDRLAVDFGIVRSFDYYTGIVLEASVPGLGLPLGGGGRYDSLLDRFGADAPAAGFAIGLERLHIALAERNATPDVATASVFVGGPATSEVFAFARTQRESGQVVVVVDGEREDVRRAAETAGASRAVWVSDGEASELPGADAGDTADHGEGGPS
jgi:ATP phosphoribosyltransferase regulatory subunit